MTLATVRGRYLKKSVRLISPEGLRVKNPNLVGLRIAREIIGFLSVTDTYIHTYIQTISNMRRRISCLALRHSAIIILFYLNNVFLLQQKTYHTVSNSLLRYVSFTSSAALLPSSPPTPPYPSSPLSRPITCSQEGQG